MNVYRISLDLLLSGVVVPRQSIELIAGLTPSGYIAQGKWYGAVFDGSDTNPFVLLNQDGHCQYAGDFSQRRYFSITTRAVRVGEVFDLTCADATDRYQYKVGSVQRLNTVPDSDAT